MFIYFLLGTDMLVRLSGLIISEFYTCGYCVNIVESSRMDSFMLSQNETKTRLKSSSVVIEC